MFSNLGGNMHSETGASLSADPRLIARDPVRGCHQIAQGMHRIRPATDSSSPMIAFPPGRCPGFRIGR
jgi:hypothetical protein